MLEEMASVFFDEANELLDNLEEQLLTLEKNPTDTETIGAVFRAMHTIKGSAAMFSYNHISTFAHEVESTLDNVRNGTIPVTSELISLTLRARDQIRDMLDAGTEPPQDMVLNSQNLSLAFKTYVAKFINKSPEAIAQEVTAGQSAGQGQSEPEKNENSTQYPTHTYRIHFKPSRKIFMTGTRPERLVREVCDLGTATVVLFTDDLPSLSKMDAEECYFSWDIILTTDKPKSEIDEVFIFLDNDSKYTIEESELNQDETHRIGEIFVDRNNISKNQIDSILKENKPIGQILVERQLVSKQQLKSALAEQEHFKTISTEAQAPQQLIAQQSIRVNADKLDYLVDLIGELVTFNARLEQIAIDKNIPVLKGLSEQCERLVVLLRDTSLDIRMLPISTLFNKFRRTVRDISEQLGKKVELIIEGADTELDKTVIDKLNDPLMHLIRNSLDHGIEYPAERIVYDKDPLGKVKLIAKHQGAFVTISVTDDGKGLDKSKILAKAIEKGLVKPEDNLSEAEIFNLIFLPGFSTAKKVSSISGRGVGMDVVKKDILALGGSVSVESEAGKGTTFILKIPLTLAIIDGMLTQIGSTRYIIPVNTIAECTLFDKSSAKNQDQLFPKANVHDSQVSCINLRSFFKITEPLPPKQELVTVNTPDGVFGLIVDKILGNRQIVIKPIGRLFQNCTGIGNTTILGDGSVAIVLDIFKLTDLIISDGKKRL